MAKKYSGITTVEYSATGAFAGEQTAISGSIASDSSIAPATLTNDTTASRIYGGEELEATIGFFDYSEYSALHTAMRADTAYYWKFTFVDGATETTADAIPFQVVKVINPDKRTGLNRYNLTFYYANDDETLESA